jgi:hypothetical protein
MSNEDRIKKGMALLAMFSPSQVDCISRAVGSYGRGLPVATEQVQVTLNYPNNPLGMLSVDDLDYDQITNIARTLGLILKDALRTNWTEGEYTDMLTQSTGIGEAAAAGMAKNIVVDDDAGITRFIVNSQLLENFTFGALPALAKLIDDTVDWLNENATENNLYEFYRCGKVAEEAFIRGKMKILEAEAQQQGLAKVDVNQIRKLRYNEIPGIISGLMAQGMSVREALTTGTAESGEPYSEEEGMRDLRSISDAIQDGMALLSRKPNGDVEQNGWLGDALSFVGKAGKGIISGIGKAFSGGGSKKSSSSSTPVVAMPAGNMLKTASRRMGRRRRRKGYRAGDLEVVITSN